VYVPKGEHTIVSTKLDVTRVKGILSSVLSGATVEPLNQGPLDGDAALAILAIQRGGVVLKKSPFGPGNAVAQVIVEDHGSTRSVELIAMRNTFGDSLKKQAAAGSAVGGLLATRDTPNPKSGRNMVVAILQALKAADPSLRQTQ
jgi:hypothetical protein